MGAPFGGLEWPSVTGHFQITNPAVTAGKPDRPLPIRKARPHPAFWIHWGTRNRKRKRRDRNVPGRWNAASCDIGPGFWRHDDVGKCDRPSVAVGRKPFAG